MVAGPLLGICDCLNNPNLIHRISKVPQQVPGAPILGPTSILAPIVSVLLLGRFDTLETHTDWLRVAGQVVRGLQL